MYFNILPKIIGGIGWVLAKLRVSLNLNHSLASK